MADVFELVNYSEAADDNTELADAEEFSEIIVRLGVYFFQPQDGHDVDLTTEDDLLRTVEGLLLQLGASTAATKKGIVFTKAKASSHRRK